MEAEALHVRWPGAAGCGLRNVQVLGAGGIGRGGALAAVAGTAATGWQRSPRVSACARLTRTRFRLAADLDGSPAGRNQLVSKRTGHVRRLQRHQATPLLRHLVRSMPGPPEVHGRSARGQWARRQTWARTGGWPWGVFATRMAPLQGNSPCVRLAGPPGGGSVKQVRLVPGRPTAVLLLQTLATRAPSRCARKTPRRKERRREQHPRFLSGRPAAPQPQMGCLLPSILRRPAFGHWRCGCERWVCSTAGPATTG
jgi:hypothetical protein